MNLIRMIFESLDKETVSGLVVFLLGASTIGWLWSVVTIAREKTEDPLDRIVWLIIVLALNIFGTILYILFSGPKQTNPHDESELKRRANEGMLK